MAPASIDWSWGERYNTQTFSSTTTTITDMETENQTKMPFQSSGPPQPQPSTAPHLRDLTKAHDYFSHGFRINAFRTAVPSPAMTATMPRLTLQPAPLQHDRTSSFAGRKRSCAEISDDEDSSDPHSTSSRSDGASGSPTKMMRSDTNGWPGAAQGGPDAMDATSQSGVWAEELAERLRSSSFPGGMARPRTLESRKSIRLDPNAAHTPSQNSISADAIRNSSDMMLDAESTVPALTRMRTGSAHDEAQLALGIGWLTLPSTPIMFAAARGWARHIESSFGLRNVRVVWRNEGMQAFLVSGVSASVAGTSQNKGASSGFSSSDSRPGSPGYFLFDEDLTTGRLVARSWPQCLDNLYTRPFTFEGEEILYARSEEEAEAGRGEHQKEEGLLLSGGTLHTRGLSLDEDRVMGMEID